jgi:death-on-curing protein
VKEPRFLGRETVLQLHSQSLLRFGGSEGIRENGLIDSALGAAMNAYFYGQGDFSDIAATYAFHIAQAQAFLDGNKRTAVATALVFLEYNGVLQTPGNMKIYDAMIAIAEKRLDKSGLAELFRRAALSAS